MLASQPQRLKHAAAIGALVLALLVIIMTWLYRDDIFQTIYDPGEPFQTYMPPPAPDYSTDSGWLMRPERGVDSIHAEGLGDIFVVAPTIFLGRTQWNAPTTRDNIVANFNRIVLPNYVMPYQLAGRVYAPSYRQAALYSFMTNREDAQAAQVFAYGDVSRAFEVFLSETPPERPIIIIGHGQGGLHVERLLADYFGDDRLRNKLAAAYVIDYPLPLTMFETSFHGLTPCASPQEVNCVIAFGAFEQKEKKRAQQFVGKTMVWEGRELTAVDGRALLCINPLLWTQTQDYAPARLHLGGVAATGLGVDTQPAPSPKQTGAQCQDGILELDKIRQKSLRRPSRFGGKFRTKPSNLFYEDLRQDAARRVQILIDKNVLPRRAPLMTAEPIEVEDSTVALPLKPIKQ